MEFPSVWIALALAFGGSLHCMGMCGGFSLIANQSARRIGISAGFMAYVGGKTLTYVFLGLILGALGSGFESLAWGGRFLAWMAGLVMVVTGAHMAGLDVAGRIASPKAPTVLVNRLSALLARNSSSSGLAMGVLNGLLPCGLLYAALAMSMKTASYLDAGFFMLVFGLGTIPSLWLAGQFVTLMKEERRRMLSRLSGWLLLLFGLGTILRATPVMAMIMSALMGNGHSSM